MSKSSIGLFYVQGHYDVENNMLSSCIVVVFYMMY